MSDHRDIDHVTGVETTGHVWDDNIKELNKPLPRWWLLTFYVTIVWAIGYWIAFPAWPTLSGYTKGVLGYSQREVLARGVKDASQSQAGLRSQITTLPLADILRSPDLARFADAAGRTAFAENCAPCHGRGAQGSVGYPNLRDDEWLWGGKPEDILQTIRFGIRSGHKQTRASQMPRYGLDNLLDDKQIFDVAEFVLSISGGTMAKEPAARGALIFKEQCAACHGDDGKGKVDQGAPNLTDQIWLYGSNIDAIVTSIRTGRGAAMPAWEGRLDPVTIKSLAVYVHSLGGGQ
jgi:cytochrome c oxidase cbb3-type subunit III